MNSADGKYAALVCSILQVGMREKGMRTSETSYEWFTSPQHNTSKRTFLNGVVNFVLDQCTLFDLNSTKHNRWPFLHLYFCDPPVHLGGPLPDKTTSPLRSIRPKMPPHYSAAMLVLDQRRHPTQQYSYAGFLRLSARSSAVELSLLLGSLTGSLVESPVNQQTCLGRRKVLS